MKRQVPVGDQVYKLLYPKGPLKPEDPTSWSSLVRKELAREARHECRSFYGDDYGTTVLQPGLEYANPSHRRRLKRFPNHSRFFLAIDRLGLTKWEIYNLCYWDCTAFARDAAQQKHPGLKIDDDTGDDVPTWEAVQAERELATLHPNEDEDCNMTEASVDFEYESDEAEDENVEGEGAPDDCYITPETLGHIHQRHVEVQRRQIQAQEGARRQMASITGQVFQAAAGVADATSSTTASSWQSAPVRG